MLWLFIFTCIGVVAKFKWLAHTKSKRIVLALITSFSLDITVSIVFLYSIR